MSRMRREFLYKVSTASAGLVVASASVVKGASAGLAIIESGTPNDDSRYPATADSNAANNCNELLNHELRPLMGPEKTALCTKYSNQVLLFVNTASRCGFTPQFEGLEKLHQEYSNRGFKVLGFPSGDFRQELDSEVEVAEFCELNYGVSFPMFEKIHVTGELAHPLYKLLAENSGKSPNWNFNKYLVDRAGNVVAHFNSGIDPLSTQIIENIEILL